MTNAERYCESVLGNLYDGVYFTDLNRTILYWNAGAERISGWTAAEVVGSKCSDNILIHVDDKGNRLCLTACPLGAAMGDGQNREADVFLHHKDGHRVPVSVRISPISDESGKIIGAVEVFSSSYASKGLEAEAARLREMMLLDPLTGVGNRRFLETSLAGIMNESSRYEWPFGLLFLDIDRFKRINDLYGHIVGDIALTAVAKTISRSVRSFDVVGRWGGEEFLVILKNVATPQLIIIAEKIRSLVGSTTIAVPNGPAFMSISIGGTTFRQDDTPESIVSRADSLMYQSKKAGRNRVTVDD